VLRESLQNQTWPQKFTLEKNMSEAKCPKCGSTQITVVSETIDKTKTKGYGWIKACLGTILTGPIGLLCGFCGKGKKKGQVHTHHQRMCLACGNKF
jgi:hypothetical protein